MGSLISKVTAPVSGLLGSVGLPDPLGMLGGAAGKIAGSAPKFQAEKIKLDDKA